MPFNIMPGKKIIGIGYIISMSNNLPFFPFSPTLKCWVTSIGFGDG